MNDMISEQVIQLNLQNSDKVAGHVPPMPKPSDDIRGKFVIRSAWMMKLGERVKNWKSRFVVLLDDGSLTYFKNGPIKESPENFSFVGTPLGGIDVRTKCVEIMDYNACNAYFAERDVRLKSRKAVYQSIKFPANAHMSNSFGIRTADRVWFLVIPSGNVSHWVDTLNNFVNPSNQKMPARLESMMSPLMSDSSMQPMEGITTQPINMGKKPMSQSAIQSGLPPAIPSPRYMSSKTNSRNPSSSFNPFEGFDEDPAEALLQDNPFLANQANPFDQEDVWSDSGDEATTPLTGAPPTYTGMNSEVGMKSLAPASRLM